VIEPERLSHAEVLARLDVVERELRKLLLLVAQLRLDAEKDM